ncbi:MAG: DUF4199 domain-containing protein [Alphaproteobacteria bacterium]|nr:DUF4199 domain-containing protein [Alphaproteobacteria bacterium]MBV9692816.1 DUF4199 domain-containing protein [Alphaproteobacteria bacterium]
MSQLRYILVYGLLSGLIIIAAIMATLLFPPKPSHSLWLGYLIMLVALSLIFVGVKRYRDKEMGGAMRFLPALGMGLAIAVVAGIAYVAVWEVYLAATHYRFMDDYTAGLLATYKAQGLSGAALAEKIASLDNMRAAYRNPLTRMGMTFIEIFPVGVLVALISAALLRNPRFLAVQRG